MSIDTPQLTIDDKQDLGVLYSAINEAVLNGELSTAKMPLPLTSSEHLRLRIYQNNNKILESDLFYGYLMIFSDSGHRTESQERNEVCSRKTSLGVR